MKKEKLAIVILIIILITTNCKKDNNFGEIVEKEPLTLFETEGLWVVNEGLFGHGNGEISFIDWKNKKIFNSQFYASNGIPAGDIPTCLLVDDDKILLVINNTSRIYILNRKDLKIKQNFNRIPSPRKIEKISTNYYAVSSFSSDSLYFLNLGSSTFNVSSIYLGKSSENLIFHDDFLYVINWSQFGGNWNNNSVMKINPHTKKLEKTLLLSKEPNSIQIDKNSNLWVLCSGGYMSEEYPALHKINLSSFEIEKTFQFNSKSESPFCLSIDTKGENLYFINNHIYKMPTNSVNLPTSPLIQSSTENYYYLTSEIIEDHVIISNAKNYQVSGEVIIYKNGIGITNRFEAGINPGFITKNDQKENKIKL